MATPKPAVVVTRKLPQDIETRLKELFETRLNADDKPMTAKALKAAVATADDSTRQAIAEVVTQSKGAALRSVILLPLIMLGAYLLLMLYFRRRGGCSFSSSWCCFWSSACRQSRETRSG